VVVIFKPFFMIASEFLKDRQHYADSVFFDSNDVIKFLKEFALLKCAEQREICANEATITNDYGSGGELFDCVDRDAIINSPNPEM